MEIFSNYGIVKTVDLPCDRANTHLNRSFAYIDFQKHDDAEKALRHMDGGQIDGQEVTAAYVLAPRPRPMRRSPNRGMPPWRRSPPRFRDDRNRRRYLHLISYTSEPRFTLTPEKKFTLCESHKRFKHGDLDDPLGFEFFIQMHFHIPW